MGYRLMKLENLVGRLKEVARKAFDWFKTLMKKLCFLQVSNH